MSQIDELRRLINGSNAQELAELKERIENVEKRASDVAEVLTPAINVGLKKNGQALVSALKEPVSLGLKQVIRSEPEEFAEILYPAMAPSIRRIISQSISSLLATINQTVASATSSQGIKTRIESFRTGVPYAELALRKSLLYRVEHVYLIDRESGIRVDEVSSDQASSLDSDAISAMFSAIQSFVQDSFSQDKESMLHDFKVGEYNVWVAHGPSLMLACVINGEAPEGLKDDLYDTLFNIRTQYANQIANFDGDVEEFLGVQELMLPLLQLQLKTDESKQSAKAQSNSKFLPLLIVFALLAGLAYYLVDRHYKVDTVDYFLHQTPGVAVTDIYWQGGKIIVEGLKDPDAKIPYAVFDAYGINNDSLELKTIPFRSLDAQMELLRFQSEFKLPKGVNLAIINNLVHMSGRAPIEWLNSHNIRIRQLATDRRLNISELMPTVGSVRSMLSQFLDNNELDAIKIDLVDAEVSQIVVITGELAVQKIAVINALFTNNQWVQLALKPSNTIRSLPVNTE